MQSRFSRNTSKCSVTWTAKLSHACVLRPEAAHACSRCPFLLHVDGPRFPASRKNPSPGSTACPGCFVLCAQTGGTTRVVLLCLSRFARFFLPWSVLYDQSSGCCFLTECSVSEVVCWWTFDFRLWAVVKMLPGAVLVLPSRGAQLTFPWTPGTGMTGSPGLRISVFCS